MSFFDDLHRLWNNFWIKAHEIHHFQAVSTYEEKRQASPLVSPKEVFTGVNVTLNKPIAMSSVASWPAPEKEGSTAFIPTNTPQGMSQHNTFLAIGHSLTLNPEPQHPQAPQTEYAVSLTSGTPVGTTMVRVDSNKNFIAHIGFVLTPSTFLDMQYISGNNMYVTTLKHLSKNASYRVTYGQMGRISLSCWKPFTSTFQAGTSFDYNINERKSNYTAAAKYRGPVVEVGGEYLLKDTGGGSNDHEVKMWLSKRATDRTTLGTEFSWNITQRTASYRTGFAYQFNSGRVRTTIDPKLRVLCMIDHQIAHYHLALSIESTPEKGDYKIGVAFQN